MPTVNDSANTTTNTAVMIRFISFTSFRFDIEALSTHSDNRPGRINSARRRGCDVVANQALQLPLDSFQRLYRLLSDLMPNAVVAA
jgi:hypothetical protein